MMPDYVYCELASEALDSAIKVIKQLTDSKHRGKVNEADWNTLIRDLNDVGKELVTGDILRLSREAECALRGCNQIFPLGGPGTERKYCKVSHRVRAYQLRQTA